MTGRFVRLGETGRATIAFTIDGRPAQALAGDTLLVALLSQVDHVRRSEFGDGQGAVRGAPRAGFCLMGACQDCWVWTADGERLRACTTMVGAGMRIMTEQPEASWIKNA